MEEFERRLAQELGWDHVIAVSNGTTGLRLMIIALGLTGELIVPALSFPATYQAVRGAGLRATLCDIEVETLGIDVEAAANLVSSSTSGILAVHQFGRPCRVRQLVSLCEQRQLALAFDAAAAIAQVVDGAPVTSFGRASVVSFHWSKVLSCMEGGAVVTADAAIADRVRELRNFGLRQSQPADPSGENGKLSDISALVGLVSLDHLQQRIAARAELHHAYHRLVAQLDGTTLVDPPGGGVAATATVLLPPHQIRTAEEVVRRMDRRGVQCRAYASSRFLPAGGRSFPGRDAVASRLVSLPLYPTLRESGVESVVRCLEASLLE